MAAASWGCHPVVRCLACRSRGSLDSLPPLTGPLRCVSVCVATPPPQLLLQVGFNKWEAMEVLPMERCQELAGDGAGGDWWQARSAPTALLAAPLPAGRPWATPLPTPPLIACVPPKQVAQQGRWKHMHVPPLVVHAAGGPGAP